MELIVQGLTVAAPMANGADAQMSVIPLVLEKFVFEAQFQVPPAANVTTALLLAELMTFARSVTVAPDGQVQAMPLPEQAAWAERLRHRRAIAKPASFARLFRII